MEYICPDTTESQSQGNIINLIIIINNFIKCSHTDFYIFIA